MTSGFEDLQPGDGVDTGSATTAAFGRLILQIGRLAGTRGRVSGRKCCDGRF
jgi:hypothetical protein